MIDARRALLRALRARWPGLVLRTADSEPWASITFTGERHRLVFAPGVDLAGIEEAEFALQGHLVADIVAKVNAAEITIEALTIQLD